MGTGWTRHIVRRRNVLKTTWPFRLGFVLFLCLLIVPTRGWWLGNMGQSLVHDQEPGESDLMIVENYGQDYLVFEKASILLRRGHAKRVLIPILAGKNLDRPNSVERGFLEVMLRTARIEAAEALPVRHEEPVTLNVARPMLASIENQDVSSVIIIAPRFRSQRTFEVYRAVMRQPGIQVTMVAAGGTVDVNNWWHSSHGVQRVLLEWFKLWYYRAVVLRRPVQPVAGESG